MIAQPVGLVAGHCLSKNRQLDCRGRLRAVSRAQSLPLACLDIDIQFEDCISLTNHSHVMYDPGRLSIYAL